MDGFVHLSKDWRCHTCKRNVWVSRRENKEGVRLFDH